MSWCKKIKLRPSPRPWTAAPAPGQDRADLTTGIRLLSQRTRTRKEGQAMDAVNSCYTLSWNRDKYQVRAPRPNDTPLKSLHFWLPFDTKTLCLWNNFNFNFQPHLTSKIQSTSSSPLFWGCRANLLLWHFLSWGLLLPKNGILTSQPPCLISILSLWPQCVTSSNIQG